MIILWWWRWSYALKRWYTSQDLSKLNSYWFNVEWMFPWCTSGAESKFSVSLLNLKTTIKFFSIVVYADLKTKVLWTYISHWIFYIKCLGVLTTAYSLILAYSTSFSLETMFVHLWCIWNNLCSILLAILWITIKVWQARLKNLKSNDEFEAV